MDQLLVHLLGNRYDLNSNRLLAVSCMLLLGKPEDQGISLDILKSAAAVTWHSFWNIACYHQSINITALGTGPNSAASQIDCKIRKIELSITVCQDTREQTNCR